MGVIKKPDEIVSKKPAAIAVSGIIHDFGRLARYFKNCKMSVIANDKPTEGFLAIGTALAPIVTLMLKPQKDDIDQ